ncbi:MAG: hypothetical protein O3A13_15645 [Proteobacteria bacterium]|nr:hypothetical protein [Pseudomonadota bacterium]
MQPDNPFLGNASDAVDTFLVDFEENIRILNTKHIAGCRSRDYSDDASHISKCNGQISTILIDRLEHVERSVLKLFRLLGRGAHAGE